MTPEEALRAVLVAFAEAGSPPSIHEGSPEEWDEYRAVLSEGARGIEILRRLAESHEHLTRPGRAGEISVRTVYGAASREPFVQVVWGREVAQFTPAEARAHAALILDAAAAAVADAFLIEHAMKEIGLDVEQAAKLMVAFREWRARRNL